LDIKLNELTDVIELQLHLMTTALFLGEFSAIFPLTQKDSKLARAIDNQDILAAQQIVERLGLEPNSLEEAESDEYSTIYKQIREQYLEIIQDKPIPLPESFLREFAEVALKKNNYHSAYNALKKVKRVEKKINELINRGVQNLQSKEVQKSDKEWDSEMAAKVDLAVDEFYSALRLKFPMGMEYQYRGVQLLTTKTDSQRKYERYVEQLLLKEIIDFCVSYLVNDQIIAEKICRNLKSNKIRKYFLRKFSINLCGGDNNFQLFTGQHLAASNNFKKAETELDFLLTHSILLGRAAGSDTIIQYLKELATRFPISPLLIEIQKTPEGLPILTPIVVKNMTLMEFLELNQ